MFMFGFMTKAIAAFKKSVIDKIENNLENDMSHPMKMKLAKFKEEKKKKERDGGVGYTKKGEDDAIIVSTPQIVQFPKFSKPLISVACGLGHILALTKDLEMYSWGTAKVRDPTDKDGIGNCGVLGFGDEEEEVLSPRLLEIKDHLGKNELVIQIDCGKKHSICLSTDNNVFTWGEGSHGRLGHGDDDTGDQSRPKELYVLSQRKPILISAGDSHCAAITESGELYTWGSGSFGKLGHGNERNQTSPKSVQFFKEENIKINNVSCGPCHTLAASVQGVVYSFGQNNNGKLGIHIQKSQDIPQRLEPVKISMYKNASNKTPFKDKQEIVQLSANFNHSMSLAKNNKIYTWGYNGRGLLARPKSQINLMPLPISFSKGFSTENPQFINTLIEKEQYERDQQKDFLQDEFWIQEIECGAANTIALSSEGEVFVFGDNSYGQHAVENLEGNTRGLGINEKSTYGDFAKITKINFNFVVKYVAIGSEHIFAISQFDECYAWGRNDEGQLGIGFLTQKIVDPQKVKEISYKGIIQISCGDNYSAALSMYGEVFVCGSLEYGKLGLGKGQKKGYQLKFRKVPFPEDAEIDYINCGVNHMFAITRYKESEKKRAGRTYAWGKNQKGQLGINNTHTQYSPAEIQNTKERFKKVCAGINYSIGLSYSGKLYFWGNFKYFCNIDTLDNILEPQLMSIFDFDIKEISCNYKNIAIISDKGEVHTIGRYLLDKLPKQGGDKEEDENLDPTKIKIGKVLKNGRFPTGKGQTYILAAIKTGPNHTIGIGENKACYAWGHNNKSNRLGIKKEVSQKDKEIEMVPISALKDLVDVKLDQYRQNAIHGAYRDDEDSSSDNPEEAKINMEVDESILDDSKIIPPNAVKGPGDVGGRDGSRVNQSKVLGQSGYKSRVQADDAEGQGEEGAQNRSKNRGNLSKISGSKGLIANPQSIIDNSQRASSKVAQNNIMGAANQIVDVAIKKDEVQFDNLPNVTLAMEEEIKNFNTQSLEEFFQKKPQFRNNNQFVKKTKQQQLSIFDRVVDLSVMEFIRQEIHQKKVPQVPQISKKSSNLIEAISLLQKILKKEDINEVDERHVQKLDKEVSEHVQNLIKQIVQFGKSQLSNAEILGSLRSYFQGRIIDIPFSIDGKHSFNLKAKEFDEQLQMHKKIVKRMFTDLQLHPCYVVNILKNCQLDYDGQKALIKTLYSSVKKTDTLRLNFLLISVFQKILPHELREKRLRTEAIDVNEPNDYIDLFSEKQEPKMISTYIFRQIFRSQYTNIDTVCTIICHIANILISSCAQNTLQNGKDTTLDLADECSGGDKKGGKGGGTSVKKKVDDLVRFIRQIIDNIKDNQICNDSTAYFSHKKNVTTIIDFLKKEFKSIAAYRDNNKDRLLPQVVNIDAQKVTQALKNAGLDADHYKDKYPSFRFSEEIIFMIGVIQKELRDSKYEGHPDETLNDDGIFTQILGLLFYEEMDLIWQKPEIKLFPYLQKTKMALLVTNIFKEQHKVNLNNLIHVFRGMIANHKVFLDKKALPGAEVWIEDINKSIGTYGIDTRRNFVQKIQSQGKEISEILSYVNFENTLIHSLEQEDSGIYVSKKLIGTVAGLLCERPNQVKVQFNTENDLLIKDVKQYNDSAKEGKALSELINFRLQGTYEDNMINLKLKTRIMAPDLKDKNSSQRKFVRCLGCNQTLTVQMAVQNFDDNIVMKLYQPIDNQSLVQSFCEVLILIDPIKELLGKCRKFKDSKNPSQEEAAIREIFNIANVQSRQDNQYHISNALQKFKKKLIVEIKNQINQENIGKAEDEQKFDFEEDCIDFEADTPGATYDRIMKRLCQQAEKKVYQRIMQDFQLKIIKAQIEGFLIPNMAARIEQFKTKIISHNKQMKQNLLLGLANQDCIVLLDKDDTNQLERLKKVVTFKKQQRKNDDLDIFLYKNSGLKKEMRGYLCLEASVLLSNKVIEKVVLKELEPLVEKSQVILMESQDGSKVEFKIVYQEIKKGLCSKSQILEEHVLLKIDISQKDIKKMRSDLSKFYNSDKKQEDINKVKLENLPLDKFIFPSNDAIIFNVEKFLALITEMERKKLLYQLKEQRNPDGTIKGTEKDGYLGKGLKKLGLNF